MTTSKHYLTDRAKREALIKTIGEGNVIATFTNLQPVSLD